MPEALVKRSVARVELELRSSDEDATPAPLTEKTVEELTWKLMKSPLKIVGFEPMKVPVVWESWIVFGPIWISWELVDAGGEPVMRRALSPERVDWM